MGDGPERRHERTNASKVRRTRPLTSNRGQANRRSGPVFEDGLPVASLVRDFAGIRVNVDRLSTTGYAVDTYPESMIITSDTDPLYNKLYYALFQNHLTELVVLLTAHTGLDESTCWKRVRATCRDVLSSLRADGAVPEDRIDRDEDALFAEQVPHKALTAMRLRGETYDYVMRPVPNPL
ncbi:MAG: ferric iron reductase [Haloferacaceae archaeon]